MKRLSFLLILVLLLSLNLHGQTAFKGCAAEGKRNKTTKSPSGTVPAKEAAMNRMKNRDDITGSIDHTITIQDLINSPEQTDLDENTAVEITGFVADVIDGTANETCNCARSDMKDIHIDMVAKQKDRNNNDKYVIVEISPRFQAKLGDMKTVKKKITAKQQPSTALQLSTLNRASLRSHLSYYSKRLRRSNR